MDININDLGPTKGEEKFKVLSSADIFVFPTFYRNEGHPWVIVEALASGLPIISTPISEVKKYKTIFLSNRRGFVKKIDEALKFRGNDEYINANKKYASENSWHKKATQILNYFDLS